MKNAVSVSTPIGTAYRGGVNNLGGAISVGHGLIAGQRRAVKYVVISMWVGGGRGAADLFEVA